MKIKIAVLILFTLACIASRCSFALAETTDEIMPPWKSKAPWPYSGGSFALDETYKEEMKAVHLENHSKFIEKAKEVLRQWGRDPDMYDYEISVFENSNFISVIFIPSGFDGFEQHVEVRMSKDDLEIVAILPGS